MWLPKLSAEHDQKKNNRSFQRDALSWSVYFLSRESTSFESRSPSFRLSTVLPSESSPSGSFSTFFDSLRRLGFSRSGSMCLVGLEGSVVSDIRFTIWVLGIRMGTGQSCSFSSYFHLPAYRWSWEVLELWRACLRSINLLLKKNMRWRSDDCDHYISCSLSGQHGTISSSICHYFYSVELTCPNIWILVPQFLPVLCAFNCRFHRL